MTLPEQSNFQKGDRVRVCGEPHNDGCDGTVHNVYVWGRYPVAVALDKDEGGIRSFHPNELRLLDNHS